MHSSILLLGTNAITIAPAIWLLYVLQCLVLTSRPTTYELEYEENSTSTTNPAYHACNGVRSLYTATKMQERYSVSYHIIQ
jgi:hypothetical protein